jgi:hypothetical protein
LTYNVSGKTAAIHVPAAGAAGVKQVVFWIPNPAFLAHFQVGLGIAREFAGFETKKAVNDFAGSGFHFGKGNGT